MSDTNDAVNDAPAVQPSPLSVMGLNLAVAFDCDPKVFPNGAEFLMFVPGRLEPIGKMEVMPGAILLAVPQETAANIRKELHRQMAAHQKKQAEALKQKG